MGLVSIDNVAQVGVIRDTHSSLLPPNAWSDVKNMQFLDGWAKKAQGHSKWSVVQANPGTNPYAVIQAYDGSQNYWVILSNTRAYTVVGASETEITRVAGNYTGSTMWTGGVFNGIGYFNKFSEPPQVWSPISNVTKLVDLPNWPAGYRAVTLRHFKNYMVALGVYNNSYFNGRTILWSHPAAPNTYPSSWDVTDATKDAGSVVLSEGEDDLLDCLPLGNANIVYSRSHAYSMTLSGTSSIFNFRRLFECGVLCQNCVEEFFDNNGNPLHFVLGSKDIIVHDGNTPRSVADERVRKAIFDTIGSGLIFNAKVAAFHDNKEMWCFYDSGVDGFTVPLTKIAIWNWQTNTWSFRDAPSVNFAATARYPPSAASLGFGRVQGKIVFGSVSNNQIYQPDSTTQFAGVSYESYLERRHITAIGMREGRVATDPERVKMMLGFRPRIEAADGVILTIQLAATMEINDVPSYGTAYSMVVGTDYEISRQATGRFLHLKIYNTSNADWKMSGYDLEIVPLGGR
jgi:hypothetical protein